MSFSLKHAIGAPFALLASADAGEAGVASDPDSWIVDGRLFGKPAKDGRPDGKQGSSDVSGLACGPATADGRVCLLVDDESQGAQIVILTEGHLLAGDFVRLSTATHDGKPLELDAEAVAWADGVFYVIGSHGRPRHGAASEEERNAARAVAAREIFAIRLPDGGVDMKTGRMTGTPVVTGSSRLSDAIRAQPALAPFFDQALEDGGVTIEGLTVKDGTAFVGFRSPVPSGAAAVLSLPLRYLFADGALEPVALHSLELGNDTSGYPRGIRDLVAIDGGFVGIAGPVHDPADNDYAIQAGDYALFRWDGAAPPELRNLGAFPARTKPEALLPLSIDDGRMHALLLFDGPPFGVPQAVDSTFQTVVR